MQPDESFVGRRQEIDQIYRLALEASGPRRHSTLLMGRRGIGKSEILRRAYNLLFWNQSRVVPIHMTVTKETQELVAFARQWLATFLRQYVGFKRRDAELINDEAMPFKRAVRLAHESDQPWLRQLVANFEESLRDEDWICLLRNSVAASLLTARNLREPIFTIVDEFQRVGRLHHEGESITLAGQFEYILQSHDAPHLIAGSSLRVIQRMLGSNLMGRHIERLRIEPLTERSSVRLWELLCNSLDVEHRRELGLEVATQLEGVPLYIQALVRAAAQQRIALTSLRNFQMVYAQDVLNGEIDSGWASLLDEALAEISDRRAALVLLKHLCQDEALKPVAWERLRGLTGLEDDELQSVAERLERAGLLEIGHSQLLPLADGVLRDWVNMTVERELSGNAASALCQELVRDRLMRGEQGQRVRSQVRVARKIEALLSQWDGQSIQPVLFAWPKFHGLQKGKLYEDIAEAIEKTPATQQLPQIVGVSPAAEGPQSHPTLLAYGFDEGRHLPGNECIVITQVHHTGEAVTATQAEDFLAFTDEIIAPTGIERVHRWLVARGGFTPEAADVLEPSEVWLSDFTQFQLITRRFGVQTEQMIHSRITPVGFAEALSLGEYALAIPMAADTELVAASAIDQVAMQSGLSDAARGQVKMAVIEACINAREHGGEMGTITLTARSTDTHLEITVENPGRVFDPGEVAEPVLEQKMGKGKSLRDKRGWGLKLMRNLMDEVVFEPTDEGTRVRMIKYRTPGAQSSSTPIIDVGKE